MTSRWHPSGTHTHYGIPQVGRLAAMRHAVWRVTAVDALDASDQDREVWVAAGMPDLETWCGRPYRVSFEFVAGVRPDWADPEGPTPNGSLKIPAMQVGGKSWDLYPESGRWPQCSCCGEPMPCRAELQDREVTAQMAAVERLAAKQPGCCWECGEPITSRQKVVTYPGENLDLPGGQTVRFHTRQQCRPAAEQYELRWIAVDPRRERILTWPKCDGILIVHRDGSSECIAGKGPFGTDHTTAPDCQGHLTHDHGNYSACVMAGNWFGQEEDLPACPRGCTQETHPGVGRLHRPERREAGLPLGGSS